MKLKIYLNYSKVQIILAKKNKTSQWLANRIGVHQDTVYHWMLKNKCPSPQNREKIKKCLAGIKWSDLFVIEYATNASEKTQ